MSEEILDIVDEHDNVIGQATRNEAHKKFLRHRFTRILVKNTAGKIILFQRTPHPKESFPNQWDSAGGHMSTGEDYLESAHRELTEEYSIVADELTEIGTMDVVIPEVENMYGKAFITTHDGPYIGDVEVGNITAWDEEEVIDFYKKSPEKFSPQAQEMFKAYLEYKEKNNV